MRATVNGVQLTYSDTGGGVPLLCLHGGMGVDAGTLHVPGILDLARHGIRASAGPVPVRTASVATDADLREHFRPVWPRFFVGDNKYWGLFETLQFAADPYNAAFTRELPGYDVRQQVQGLRVPTLLIVGSDDPYRAHMEWLAEHVPNASLRVLEGVGHFPFIEAAPEFTLSVAAFVNTGAQPRGCGAAR